MSAALTATLAAVLLVLLADPRTLLRRPLGRGPAEGQTRGARPAIGGRPPTGLLPSLVRVAARLLPRRRNDQDTELGALCTQVASRLRAGATVAHAWQGALGRAAATGGKFRTPDGDVTPGGDAAEAPPALLDRASTSAAAAAVVVACRLSARCGTPLAEILDECAHGITEVAAAEAERRRVLAGPASTARLLGWLPVGSVLLGAGLGADPVGVVLDGGPAAVSLVLGTGLLVLGRCWIRALVAVASRPGG